MKHCYSEVEIALDKEFDELIQPNEWLGLQECKANAVYWGSGTVGEIAVCRIYEDGRTKFWCLNNNRGRDYLSVISHRDDTSADTHNYGTFKPFVEVGKLSADSTQEQQMDYLLDTEIKLRQEKINWLKNMPDRLKASRYFSLEDEIEYLNAQIKLKQHGFCTQILYLQ